MPKVMVDFLGELLLRQQRLKTVNSQQMQKNMICTYDLSENIQNEFWNDKSSRI